MVVYVVTDAWEGVTLGVFSTKEKAANAMIATLKKYSERNSDFKETYAEDVEYIKENYELMDVFYTEDIEVDRMLP